MTLFGAYARALRDVFKPRILGVLVLPMLGAIVLWTALAWFFWEAWMRPLRAFLGSGTVAAWFGGYADTFASGSAALLLFALVIGSTFVTAIVITELVAMPVIVSTVEREYPQLAKRGGMNVTGSIVNAVVAVGVFALLWIVTLPLWLTGFGAVLVPALTSAYLMQRLFRFDALSEHATRDEYREIVSNNGSRLYGLGLALAPVYYVPFVNLVAPVLSGLAFTHFCLAELERHRRGP
ncbi:MAG TPA: EI24 domain-containing protein [Burkholderiales bacterium]|nr:EI24 domain-containing protein [Burkholderiales bacterium]